MILRIKFNKKNYLKYISHLDLMRLFQRSFNRANIPIKYTEGFNPHPKFSIGVPLSLGIESEEEYMDIELEYMLVDEFIERMNKVLPKDIQIIDGRYLEKEESLNALISWAYYEIQFEMENKKNKEELTKVINNWLSKDRIIITKLGKKNKKKVEKEENIRPYIGNINVKDVNEYIVIDTLLKSGSNGNLKPTDLLNALDRENDLNINMDTVNIKRLGLYAEKENNIFKPL